MNVPPQYNPYPHYGPPQPGPPPPGPMYHNTYAPVTSQANNQSTNVVVNLGDGTEKVGRNARRDWSTQICGCCEDCGGCLCVCFFTPCMMLKLASQLDESCCVPLIVPQALMAMRIKLRESNKIQGSILTDCICTSCCPMLTMCQMARELDNIEKGKPKTQL